MRSESGAAGPRTPGTATVVAAAAVGVLGGALLGYGLAMSRRSSRHVPSGETTTLSTSSNSQVQKRLPPAIETELFSRVSAFFDPVEEARETAASEAGQGKRRKKKWKKSRALRQQARGDAASTDLVPVACGGDVDDEKEEYGENDRGAGGAAYTKEGADTAAGNGPEDEVGSASSAAVHPGESDPTLFQPVPRALGAGFAGIRAARVVVVGLGGVGSHCATSLCRSGVGTLRLIDFDQVTLSSLNRHAVAQWEDVGTPKAETMRRRLVGIPSGSGSAAGQNGGGGAALHPECCHVQVRVECLREDNVEQLLLGGWTENSPDDNSDDTAAAAAAAEGREPRPDWVIDCIDDLETKQALLAFCLRNNLRVISSTSAGARADPTRLHIGTMREAVKDPLAARLRYGLRRYAKLTAEDLDKIVTVFSSEKPVCGLLPFSSKEQEEKPQEFGAMEGFRVRVIPVMAAIPAIFGQAMASYVLCGLAEQPFTPVPLESMARKVRHKMMHHLKMREAEIYGDWKGIEVDFEDIEFVCMEVWRGRCAQTGERVLTVSGAVELVRWDHDQTSHPGNLVLLKRSVVKELDARGREALGEAAVRYIEQRLAFARKNWKFA